MEEEDRHER